MIALLSWFTMSICRIRVMDMWFDKVSVQTGWAIKA